MAETQTLPVLGIREIDDQHAQLVACLDRLALWVGKGQGFAAALDALQALNDYVDKHFSYEERFLAANGYPKLDEHIAEHGRIRDELAKLNQEVLDGGDISEELLALVRQWIVSHIGVEDREYAKFVAR